MKRFTALLIALVLIMGLGGCPAASVQVQLDISSTSGGSVTSPGEGTFTHEAGKVVELVAVPDECYEFVNWTGDAVDDSHSATTTIIMDAAKSVTASFAVLRYNLVIGSTEGGSVITPGEGTFTYDCAALVPLVAEAKPGYLFVTWTGSPGSIADVNAATSAITMRGDYSITAEFGKPDPATLFAGGSGTKGEPFQIVDWHQLANVRYFLDAHYRLMNSLNSNTSGYRELASSAANQGRGWQPIGAQDGPFAGTFDGLGCEIRDLFVNRPNEDHVGLIGYVSAEALIQNLGVVNSIVVGRFNVGRLVGWNEGTVSHSYSTGIVIGERNVGGFAGVVSSGTVSNSYSSGSVTGRTSVGGMVGNNSWGAVSNSYADASASGDYHVGGLVGSNYESSVSNCYSSGRVSGIAGLGGLVGWSRGTVSNSFWDTQTSGQTTSAGGMGKTNTQMKSTTTFSSAGWNIIAVANSGTRNASCIWNIVAGQTYPFLSWEPVT